MSEKKKVDILPAVLPQSFSELEEKLTPLQDVVRQVQVDVVDGHYAKGKTWPYRDRATFDKLVQEEHGMPFWDKIDYQFDLMVEDPFLEIKQYIQAGATQVVLHVRSKTVAPALQVIVDMRTEDVASFPVHAGIGMAPTDSLELLEPFEAQFDFVQVMGITREGRQGEPFDKHALYLVERLRNRYQYLPIQVDGGVSMENARDLAHAGATKLIAGSAIFAAEDPIAAYHALTEEANRP
jgi:ribulose-phosphate 3-epimerase